MQRIILLKGLPASGKSTYAKKIVDETPGAYVRVNKDDLRSMLHNSRWSKSNEKQVLRIRDLIIEDALKNGQSVIIDDTNLAPKHQARMVELATKYEVSLDVFDMFLDISVEECIRRDLKRENSVGEKVIKDMYKKFIAPKNEKTNLNPLVFNDDLPYCVIFDLDGTLAMIGDRSPYDGKSCEVDTPNQSVVKLNDIIRDYSNLFEVSSKENIKTIIFSGRNGDSREQTEAWLDKHHIDHDGLFMREAGDKRKDSVIKKEMFDKYIKDQYNILFVVDDRSQVVDMWRSMGITCLQVNYGDF